MSEVNRRDLEPPDDLEPAVGLLAAMLADVRRVTLHGIEGMSADALFRPPAPGEYPLGAYLMHLGETEVHWLEVLTGEPVADDVKREIFFDAWFDPSGEPRPPAEPLPLEEYVSRLAMVRRSTLAALRRLRDSELDGERTAQRGDRRIATTPRWILYHLVEHEAHHRGQMMLWKRRMQPS